jgi:squalene-hopene/tetraprenyl-beta-curcumene cyclase
VSPSDPALRRAGEWVLGEEITVRGDWAVQRPDLAPGGWAFEFANDIYPDVDDTAEVVLALRRMPDLAGVDGAVQRGIDWVVGMQCADGGWAAFDADNTGRLPEKLPFSDFGAVIDPPTADVTAHVVEMLAQVGRGDDPVTARGIAWLRDAQEADGSWFGRWGTNYVYGTGAVVPALIAAGVDAGDESVTRAIQWLEEHQNDDGGWGEDLRSYRDESWIGRGAQTAWALLALLAVDPATPAVERGIAYLVDTQRVDGCWDEDLYTGTGFPGDFYINYEMYRLVFPISAIGRYVAAHAERGRDG